MGQETKIKLSSRLQTRRYNQGMRRLFVVAAFVSVLAVLPLHGQMRGGRAGASVGRGGFSSRGSGFVGRGGFNRGGFGFGHGPRFFGSRGPFFHRGFVSRGRPVFFGGSFYWGPSYYPWYDTYPYAAEVVTAPPPQYYPDEYYERGGLRQDIDVLNGKVDHLQKDMESRLAVPRPPTKQESTARQSTMLVFKDKRRQEIQNYAVVGGTLWILDEKKASKVPLSDLDVEATTRLNDERGVEFELPR